LFFKSILACCFYSIFDQINAAFQGEQKRLLKHKKKILISLEKKSQIKERFPNATTKESSIPAVQMCTAGDATWITSPYKTSWEHVCTWIKKICGTFKLSPDSM